MISFLLILILVVYAAFGWRRGGVKALVDLAVAIGSLLLALTYFERFGVFLAQRYTLAGSWGKVMAFVLVWIIGLAVLECAAILADRLIPWLHNRSPLNRWLGIAVNLATVALVIGTLLALLANVSIKFPFRDNLLANPVGKVLQKMVFFAEKPLGRGLGS